MSVNRLKILYVEIYKQINKLNPYLNKQINKIQNNISNPKAEKSKHPKQSLLGQRDKF